MGPSEDKYSSSPTDWKLKYIEAADMLAETRAELDDFHYSSKELEEELIRELERTEKAQQDLKVKVVKAESDRDDWKSKFLSLQTTHNTTTTMLHRELDTLRQEYQITKIQLRELEMGNDDLERSERAVSSTLVDMETKYSRALEEKILLEQELLDKANVEEEVQRLKDELRDANVEIVILRERLLPRCNAPTTSIPAVSCSDEDLLNTQPPPDLQLSDLSPSSDDLPAGIPQRSVRQPTQQIDISSNKPRLSITSTMRAPSLTRTSNAPSFSSQLRAPSQRTPVSHMSASRNFSASPSSTASTFAPSKNKGVQMVSEMRARVRNLEQKIHTRVPRLRMGSLTARPSAINSAPSVSSSTSSKALAKANASGSQGRQFQRHSFDVEVERKDTSTDATGWVLVMEGSPVKDNQSESRRATASPTLRTKARPLASSHMAPPAKLDVNVNSPLSQSTMNVGFRRQSRPSSGSLNSATSSGSLPPLCRPATPTFLPVPSTRLYSFAGGSSAKRSSGPSAIGHSKR